MRRFVSTESRNRARLTVARERKPAERTARGGGERDDVSTRPDTVTPDRSELHVRAEQRKVEKFVKREYWRMAQRDPERFAHTRAPFTPDLYSSELPRDSGEVAAVNGPTTLGQEQT